jgi:hypothetical protein
LGQLSFALSKNKVAKYESTQKNKIKPKLINIPQFKKQNGIPTIPPPIVQLISAIAV